MIPHRTATEEIFGNELKERVTACRKRLRVNRASQRERGHAESVVAETPNVAQFPAESPAVRQLVRVDLTPVLAHGGQDSDDGRELIGQQEVGVT